MKVMASGSCTLINMGKIALQIKAGSLSFDPVASAFLNDDEANR
jgi:hypothetical protein